MVREKKLKSKCRLDRKVAQFSSDFAHVRVENGSHQTAVIQGMIEPNPNSCGIVSEILADFLSFGS